MAQVPISRGRAIAPAPVARERLRPADNGGGALGGFSAGLQRAGQATSQFAEEQDRREELLDDAATKKLDNIATERMRSLLRTGENAYFGTRGFGAANARPVTEKALADLGTELMGQATTERQKRMFGEVWNRRVGAELEGIARHAVTEISREEEAQSIARQSNFGQDAVANAADPERFAELLQGGLGELQSRATKNGWSTDRAELERREFVSSAHEAVIRGRLSVEDIDGAAQWLDTHRDELDWKAEASLQAALTPALQKRETFADVDGIMGLPPVSKGDAAPVVGAGTMFETIVGIESRGRQFAANGQPLTSPKGAIGVAQVMPGTGPEAARLAKLPWDPARFRNDAEYNAALGRAYFQAQLRKYGDPRLAAAAYNAGPGRVDDALRKGGRDGWLQHVPAETRAYVAKFGTNVGAAATGQTPDRPDLGELLERVDAIAERSGWTFERRERARQEVERRVSRADQLKNRDEAEAYDDALTRADQLGDSFTDVGQLGPSFSRMSPQQQHTLRERAKFNAKPKELESNGDAAITLKVLAARDPEAFKNMDLREYRHLVTPGELASLAVDQAQLRAKPADAPPTANLRSEIDTAIRFHGKDIGLDVGKRSSDTQRKQYGRISDAMRSYVERVTGGKRAPTDDELKAAFDSATMEVVVRGDGWFGRDRTVRRFEIEDGGRFGIPIPAPTRERIVNTFSREARRKPTDDEIARIYLQNKGRPGFWN